jgi:hypothetical protein
MLLFKLRQLCRCNLPRHFYKYYRGKRYETEKQLHGGNRKSTQQNVVLKGDTSKRLAKESGVSHMTIDRDAAFARGVDLVDKAKPGFRNAKARASRMARVYLHLLYFIA